MSDGREQAIAKLQQAYGRKDLTLLLGAGVSVGSGLPNWEKLVPTMYFGLTSDQKLGGCRPFPNYLYAIAEWHLARQQEPLEVTVRKLQLFFDKAIGANPRDVIQCLHDTLYAPYLPPPDLLDSWAFRQTPSQTMPPCKQLAV